MVRDSVTKTKEVEENEIREENRKIRFLRFLVDFSLLSIQQDELSFEEALRIVKNVKQTALGLFPGKGEAFELIYRPRFRRVIEERFGIQPGERIRDPGN